MTMTLYHYTCRDVARAISRRGMLIPQPQLCLPGRPKLVWMTDLAAADVAALGLESPTIGCDRTEARYAILTTGGIIPWREWATAHRVPVSVLQVLEQGRKPEHWFVSESAVLAERTRQEAVG